MKRIALFLALLMLVFSVAGCAQEKVEPVGSGQINSDPVNSDPTNTQETTTSSETEGTTAATVKMCEHEYGEKVEQDATCMENGILLLQCTKCGESMHEQIPAFGHRGSGASCTEPSFCILCGEMEEPAWGHDDQNGICRNCGLEMGVPQIPEETTEATQPQE